MQAQERELITGLFGALQPFEPSRADGEAAGFDQRFRRPPAVGALYLLVQTVLVQGKTGAQGRAGKLISPSWRSRWAPPAPGFLGSAPKIGSRGASPAAPEPRRSRFPRHGRRCRRPWRSLQVAASCAAP